MKLLTLLSVLVLLAYPLAVYYGLSHWGIGAISALLVMMFVLRIIGGNQTRLRELKYITWLSGCAGIALSLLAYLFKNSSWFTYYPIIVNLLMLTVFMASLWQKETLCERFARLQEPQLPDYAILYTRQVTKVWCVFFIINATISLTTGFMSMEIWTLYNGLISYLLAGTLFACEYVMRLYVKRKNNEF
ncbi:hypothetical protein [Psychromonas sp. MME2]|uniref:COG4648 family protein n=1 Tax=unclassified Psychromonas TaxID=2614957 RepID=UPI00339CC2D3